MRLDFGQISLPFIRVLSANAYSAVLVAAIQASACIRSSSDRCQGSDRDCANSRDSKAVSSGDGDGASGQASLPTLSASPLSGKIDGVDFRLAYGAGVLQADGSGNLSFTLQNAAPDDFIGPARLGDPTYEDCQWISPSTYSDTESSSVNFTLPRVSGTYTFGGGKEIAGKSKIFMVHNTKNFPMTINTDQVQIVIDPFTDATKEFTGSIVAVGESHSSINGKFWARRCDLSYPRTELEGRWTQSSGDFGKSSKEIYIKGTTAYISTAVWENRDSALNAESPLYYSLIVADFTIGNATAAGKEISLTLVRTSITVNPDATTLEKVNASKLCGLKGWAGWQTRNVTGLDCVELPYPLKSKGDILYELFHLANGQLTFGDTSGGKDRTADTKRPSAIDQTRIFTLDNPKF